MEDTPPKPEPKGSSGRLRPCPGKAQKNSFIAREQASRQRKGLPLLPDTDIAGPKAGEPMPWERGDGAPSPSNGDTATPAPTAPAQPTTTSAAPAAVSAAAATASTPKPGITAEVEKMVAAGKKWSKSAIAAEQARRQRKGLTPFTDAEVTALLGEEAAAPAAA